MRRYPYDDEEEELPTGTKAAELLHDPSMWRIGEMAERWEKGRPLVHEPDVPLFVKTEMKMHLDSDAWGIGFLEVNERELPGELYADLRERAPQSLLRDLHRPVRDFYVTPEVIEGSEWSMLGEAWRIIQEGRVNLPELPTIEPLTRAVREEQLRRRELFAERWQPIKPDDAPRQGISLNIDGADLEE